MPIVSVWVLCSLSMRRVNCHDCRKRDHRNAIERALEPEPANGYDLLIVFEVPGTCIMRVCSKRSDEPPGSPFQLLLQLLEVLLAGSLLSAALRDGLQQQRAAFPCDSQP